jgi:glycosyltransferase involved in cell wall biosynthesis
MKEHKLLVLDTSFSYEAIVKRRLQNSVTCRDLDGYFSHVWSIHPFATLVTTDHWTAKYGEPVIYSVSQNHTFIEGKIGLTKYLKIFSTLNFILSQIRILKLLVNLIKKEKISVIRSGDPLYLGLISYVLSKITQVPYVVRVGANYDKIRESTGRAIMPRLFIFAKIERIIEKFILSNADLVAGANEDNLKFAIASGAKPEKSTVFRYGNLIDPSHFIEPKMRVLNTEVAKLGKFILCIARLEPVKKVDDVIRVLSIVRKNGFDVHAMLVGEGREMEKLQKLAKELNVYEYVIFCGNKDQNWLSSTIPCAAVVISPHTGRALTEAALGAVPIAAYDIDWQSELIQTEDTGEIVPYGDYDALAISTIKLIKDTVYAKKMSVRVREKVLDMMDPIKLNMIEKKYYNRITKNNQNIL